MQYDRPPNAAGLSCTLHTIVRTARSGAAHVEYWGETMIATRRVDRIFEHAVEAGLVPGVIALAANAHGVVYEGAFGRREIGTEAAMTLDSVVRIASMTKPITAVAALQLVEQGRLTLD